MGIAFSTIPAASAGPVERELRSRGGDVGFPKPRPGRAATRKSLNDAIPNPLDASRDGKIRTRPIASSIDIDETDNAAPKNSVRQTEEVAVEQAESNLDNPTACFQALVQIAEAKRVLSPEAADPACVIEDPVVMSKTVSPYPVQFARNLTLDCPFALALAKFSDATTQALARHHLGTTIEKIHSGEGFVCRRRNNAPTGKLSEHSFGNATDWVGFTFADGSRMAIKTTDDMDDDEAAFLNSVRKAACGTFTTVLGPGSNAAHSSHFHFDLGRSKDRKNPYRICE